ncbi:YOS1 family protein [Aspergillus affinis]|uniref:YOS1 family protein n=1 Tax=Aspergillus affinis TaxID=1070780 RepID=UPI0022FDFCE3|nr:uncharacterized protein KD926_008952 [Aspergillus affinis]KAI9039966.1 hypothetical protein KD926_008952 [Aspergillus affinis]
MLGRLIYVLLLMVNAIAVLSEDRFLARIGFGRPQADPAFGATYDSTSVKAKSVNLIASVRTVMRTNANALSGYNSTPNRIQHDGNRVRAGPRVIRGLRFTNTNTNFAFSLRSVSSSLFRFYFRFDDRCLIHFDSVLGMDD